MSGIPPAQSTFDRASIVAPPWSKWRFALLSDFQEFARLRDLRVRETDFIACPREIKRRLRALTIELDENPAPFPLLRGLYDLRVLRIRYPRRCQSRVLPLLELDEAPYLDRVAVEWRQCRSPSSAMWVVGHREHQRRLQFSFTCTDCVACAGASVTRPPERSARRRQILA